MKEPKRLRYSGLFNLFKMGEVYSREQVVAGFRELDLIDKEPPRFGKRSVSYNLRALHGSEGTITTSSLRKDQQWVYFERVPGQKKQRSFGIVSIVDGNFVLFGENRSDDQFRFDGGFEDM